LPARRLADEHREPAESTAAVDRGPRFV
jgi:hypothetical protein